MNLHHLKIFHTVAETGSLTAAAKKLHTAQPALSRQLAALEHSLNTRLLDRLPRGTRLTPSGQLLLSYSTRLFQLESEAARALADLHGLHRGSLTLGASLTIGSYLLPPLLAQFQKQHPALQLTLLIANTDEIHRRLLAGQLDLGFSEGLLPSPDLTATIFAHDHIAPVAPPNHPLTRATPTPRMLLHYPLILREPGSGTRAIVEQALRRAKIPTAHALSLGNAEAIKSAVLNGAGIAFLSTLAISHELNTRQLATLPLPSLHIHRNLYHLHPAHHTPSHAATAFLALLHHTHQTHRPPKSRQKR
ncbi:MAG: LysR substrate-binding domain-containing protein [Phycisphaerae bacterium]